MAKKRFFFGGLAMVLALVFGLVLAGCSTDSDDSSNNNPNTETPSTEITKSDFQGTWTFNQTLVISEGGLNFNNGNAVFTITSWGNVVTGSSNVTITITGTMTTPSTGVSGTNAGSIFASGVTSLELTRTKYTPYSISVKQGGTYLSKTGSGGGILSFSKE